MALDCLTTKTRTCLAVSNCLTSQVCSLIRVRTRCTYRSRYGYIRERTRYATHTRHAKRNTISQTCIDNSGIKSPGMEASPFRGNVRAFYALSLVRRRLPSRLLRLWLSQLSDAVFEKRSTYRVPPFFFQIASKRCERLGAVSFLGPTLGGKRKANPTGGKYKEFQQDTPKQFPSFVPDGSRIENPLYCAAWSSSMAYMTAYSSVYRQSKTNSDGVGGTNS